MTLHGPLLTGGKPSLPSSTRGARESAGEHGNENAIAALAIFGFFNFAAFTSDSPDKLTEILLANCVCVIGLVATRFSPWVERAFLIFLYVLMLGAIAVLAWLITEYRLYEVPYIRDYLQHLAIFVPPNHLGVCDQHSLLSNPHI